jgi:hypothetical protein
VGTPVTLNSTSYTIPAVGEDDWGTNVSSYLIAISTGVLTKSGGAFTLTAETDFGPNFGLKSLYYKSRGTVSTTGILRLANDEEIGWRLADNSANKTLKLNTSDILEFDGSPLLTLALGASNTVLRMNSDGSAYEFAKLVNADVDASAAIAYSKLALTDSIVNADVSASAAIAYSKLALTNSIVNADVSASASIAYSKLALTDSIVNADIASAAAIAYSKLALTGSILNADINASAAIDASKIANGSVSNAEFQTLDGVTSAIQTQLNAKLDDFTATSDNRLIRANGTGGDAIQGSAVSLDDSGNMTGVLDLNLKSITAEEKSLLRQPQLLI